LHAELHATILPGHLGLPPPQATLETPFSYPSHLWQIPPPAPLPELPPPTTLFSATSYLYPTMMPAMCWPGQMAAAATPFMLPTCPPPALPQTMKRKSHYEENGEDMYKRQRLCTGN
jgi:hypothetical protein